MFDESGFYAQYNEVRTNQEAKRSVLMDLAFLRSPNRSLFLNFVVSTTCKG